MHHAKECETEATKLLTFPVASFWNGTYHMIVFGFCDDQYKGSLCHETEESYCLYKTEEDAIVLADTCCVQTLSGTSIPRTLFTPFCDVF